MKKHDCSNFLEEVLTAEKSLSEAAAEHVLACPECAALRKLAEQCTACKDMPEVPEELDRNVLAYASQAKRRRNIHQLFFRRIIPVTAAAAAAVVCIIAVLPEENQEIQGMPAAEVTLAAADATNEWNRMENEAFDLNYELISCQQAVSDWQEII